MKKSIAFIALFFTLVVVVLMACGKVTEATPGTYKFETANITYTSDVTDAQKSAIKDELDNSNFALVLYEDKTYELKSGTKVLKNGSFKLSNGNIVLYDKDNISSMRGTITSDTITLAMNQDALDFVSDKITKMEFIYKLQADE